MLSSFKIASYYFKAMIISLNLKFRYIYIYNISMYIYTSIIIDSIIHHYSTFYVTQNKKVSPFVILNA